MSAELLIGTGANRAPFDVQLKRYHRSYRRRLRRLASGSRPLTDLLYTFPALALILACGQGSLEERRAAIMLVTANAGLRQVAAVLGVPMWLRRLPPEAFGATLGPLADAPSSDRFQLRIVNRIPAAPGQTQMWLAWVLQAHRLGGETFALWIAAQSLFDGPAIDAEALLPLAAYAWFSDCEGVAARRLIARGWTPEGGLARAIDETRNFVMRVVLDYCMEDGGANGRWFVPQKVSGLRFVPLRSAEALVDEGNHMTNCVANYAHQVAIGESLIYSIRRGNEHVATLEVRTVLGQAGRPFVAQLEGPGNTQAPEAVQRAVASWIVRQGRYPAITVGDLAGVTIDAARWHSIWQPFWAANPAVQTFARLPISGQLFRLAKALAALATLAKAGG